MRRKVSNADLIRELIYFHDNIETFLKLDRPLTMELCNMLTPEEVEDYNYRRRRNLMAKYAADDVVPYYVD